MTSKRPIVRRASAADLDAFYPEDSNRPTMTALVGELDGELIGCGGFAHIKGVLFGFCDLKPEARRYKLSIGKAARKLVASIAQKGGMLYADADPNEPGAVRWLKSLGFEAVEDKKSRFRWRAHCRKG